MAELVFFSGTMDCGKSTLALQMAYNYQQRGLTGIIFAMNDRAGEGKLSSRLGLVTDAIEVTHDTNFWNVVVSARQTGQRVDFIICDEVQFYSREQINQLARVVDEMHISVWGFGITTDFTASLFPGSARMLELADRVERLQVEALCWCGKRATHNARTVNGVMVTEGEQVVIGDTNRNEVIGYEVLCRYHHMQAMTAKTAHAADISPETLDLGITEN
ncbi:thymidine kinase [Arcanobacterium buesumense]|uniref:Thymidine kinase n=1 Tax=Arcanobacterium buesumense TaxID=2722751 RepID=A0A6H2EKD0_9ACTO|nr:thymidine kinase [Arcanobacterium buesumense]QJC21690.1 thymidine kinase [Arcanobacterium buesumense]